MNQLLSKNYLKKYLILKLKQFSDLIYISKKLITLIFEAINSGFQKAKIK